MSEKKDEYRFTNSQIPEQIRRRTRTSVSGSKWLPVSIPVRRSCERSLTLICMTPGLWNVTFEFVASLCTPITGSNADSHGPVT
jgi:hypothetical protein